MQNVKVTKEIDAAIDNQIGELINRVTCQLFTQGGKFEKDPLGTGIFLQLDKDYLLLTAAHVAEHLGEGIYVFTPDGNFVELFGHLELTNYQINPRIDVAYIKLQKELEPVVRQKFKFLHADDLMLSHEPLDAAQYLAFGYPSRNLSSKGNIVSTKAVYYQMRPAKENVHIHYKFEKTLFYVLEFKGKGINVRSGEKTKKLGSQKGISGGGLWIINIDKVEESYSVNFKLTGIMTDERIGRYHCLIANKIDALISGIAQLEGNISAKKLITDNPNNTIIYAHRRAE